MKTIIFFSISLIFVMLTSAFAYEKANGCSPESLLVSPTRSENFFFNEYQFKDPITILDISSGDGSVASKVAQKNPKGFILSLNTCHRLFKSSVYQYKTLPNLEFTRQNIEDPRFYNKYLNYFDVVVSFSALHYFKEHEQIFKGIYQVLKPGGYAFIRVLSGDVGPLYRIVNELKTNDAFSPYFKDFESPLKRMHNRDLFSYLAQFDFQLVKVTQVTQSDALENKEVFEKYLMNSLLEYVWLVEKASEKIANNYIQAIIESYLKQKEKTNEVSSFVQLQEPYLEIVLQKK